MTPDKILEIARRHADAYKYSLEFTTEDIISFAQAIIEAIIEERESIGEPVAWIDHEGGLYHYKLYETYLPLYRRPLPMARLTDEEINDCFDIAQRSFHKHQSGIKGQQLNIQDWPNWHFARAIEQKIWGRAE